MKRAMIAVNATMIFIAAYLCQGSLHEVGHLIAALWLHASHIVFYHNYVQNDSSALSDGSKVLIAAAGPLMSLLSALVGHVACARVSKRNMGYLFLVFFTAFGYINIGGYLMMSPFFSYGDTGFIFTMLGFSFVLKLMIALAAVGALYLVIQRLCPYFLSMASADVLRNHELRTHFVSSIIMYPVLIGLVCTTLCELPVPTFLSLMYPMFSPFTLFWVYGSFLSSPYTLDRSNAQFDKFSALRISAVLVCLLMVVLNRIFAFGIQV